jgi:sodium/bile acid cotransporter 7
MGLDLHHGIVLLTLLPLLHLGSLLASFGLFQNKIFNFSRREQVAAMFCASHKTLAFGLPLVNTIFEGNSNLAAYCAPIMFIHPLQLVLGSLLVPRLSKYISHLDAKDDNNLQN